MDDGSLVGSVDGHLEYFLKKSEKKVMIASKVVQDGLSKERRSDSRVHHGQLD